MLFLFNGLIGALLGAFVGKYLAMVTHYLPKMLLEQGWEANEPSDIVKWFFKRPTCSHCQKALNWLDNAPIYGYLSQKGQCPHCQHPIGKKTLVLELGTALLFGSSLLFFPLSAMLTFVLLVSCILICCFATDYEHGILPDQFTLTLIWVGLIGSLIPIFATPKESILGAVGGYGIFWFFNIIYRYFRGVEGMYPGDFKLNAGIGACLGLTWLFSVLALSFLFLLAFTAAQFFFFQRKADTSFLRQEVPYGCFASIITGITCYAALV